MSFFKNQKKHQREKAFGRLKELGMSDEQATFVLDETPASAKVLKFFFLSFVIIGSVATAIIYHQWTQLRFPDVAVEQIKEPHYLFYTNLNVLPGVLFFVSAFLLIVWGMRALRSFPELNYKMLLSRLFAHSRHHKSADIDMKRLKQGFEYLNARDEKFKAMKPREAFMYFNEKYPRSKKLSMISAGLLIACSVIYVLDNNNYKVLFPQGLVHNAYFSMSEEFYPVENTDKVMIGCRAYKKKSRKIMKLVYKLVFDGGVSIDLLDSSARSGVEQFQLMKQMDQILMDRNIPIETFASNKIDKSMSAPEYCKKEIRKWYGPAADAVIKIMRLN